MTILDWNSLQRTLVDPIFHWPKVTLYIFKPMAKFPVFVKVELAASPVLAVNAFTPAAIKLPHWYHKFKNLNSVYYDKEVEKVE